MVDLAEENLDTMPADEYLYLREMAAEHIIKPDYDFTNEFKFALELFLDSYRQKQITSPGGNGIHFSAMYIENIQSAVKPLNLFIFVAR